MVDMCDEASVFAITCNSPFRVSLPLLTLFCNQLHVFYAVSIVCAAPSFFFWVAFMSEAFTCRS